MAQTTQEKRHEQQGRRFVRGVAVVSAKLGGLIEGLVPGPSLCLGIRANGLLAGAGNLLCRTHTAPEIHE